MELANKPAHRIKAHNLCSISNLGSVVQPGVHGVTSRTQVGFSKLIFFRPAEWCVAQTLLDDGVEPRQQEVETSTLIRSLKKHKKKKKIVTRKCRQHRRCTWLMHMYQITLHMRATGMLLKVRSMLALTPGGGSNTKIRPARSRFTGTWQEDTELRLWGVKEEEDFGAGSHHKVLSYLLSYQD